MNTGTSNKELQDLSYERALELAIIALETVPSFDTVVFSTDTRRALTSYELIPYLRRVLYGSK